MQLLETMQPGNFKWTTAFAGSGHRLGGHAQASKKPAKADDDPEQWGACWHA